MKPRASLVFGPHRLVSLLLTPRAFFSHADLLRDRLGIIIAAALVGVSNAMGRLDQNLSKADLRQQQAADGFTSWATSSWPHYWIIVLLTGLVSAVFSWYIGGWFYRKRLEWSGAGQVEPDDARSLSVLQDMVWVLPMMLLALIQTFSYANYVEAWAASTSVSAAIMIFVFWSCWTSYCAATTVYSLKKTQARIWFLILPAIFYVIILGAFGALYAMLPY
ncbi:hypothetical protein GJ698_01600 [Pseudoduganella sp. FT26W]|uniref:Yip1 domain-containing protein n=1 Tax=Duganella aquatilis TaxID=2666082 RepID=A0A844D3R5_9BURK|nr:YIP1 family protein [Duganella aquatilis]MRW82786.1 hypothetical protein [Duganella aquatilis]